MKAGSVFPVLYGLAARAPALGPSTLHQRLVTGLASHYGAVACALHMDGSGWAAAAADPAPHVAGLSRLDRARLETLEARLARQAAERGEMASAQDLEDRADRARSERFLQRTLGIVDIFAFPIRRPGRATGVLVLHLDGEGQPLGDADLQALTNLGPLLDLAGSQNGDGR